jgi:ATPase subunit of ABC transporter with duplicated ATPase domains
MALLSGSNLSKSFGSADIFSGVTLSVARGRRIAIVGPNGIGKTTLLRILIGLDEPSAGTVQRAKSLSIGFLPQEADLSAPHSLWEECLSAFADLRQREAELAGLEAAMSDPARSELALERYGPLQHEFERLGGYTYETRIRQTLSGLGFDPNDFHRPLTQLSGGQRTRALLARLLLSNPDLLVLDEPTNHLDMAAVEWLEGYLAAWEGTALIVSHDRYFLDQVVNGIWEMSRSGLESYPGNYTAYLTPARTAGSCASASSKKRKSACSRRSITSSATSPGSAPCRPRASCAASPAKSKPSNPWAWRPCSARSGARSASRPTSRRTPWAWRRSSGASEACGRPAPARQRSRSPSKPAVAPATSCCAPPTWWWATPASPSFTPMTSSCAGWSAWR